MNKTGLRKERLVKTVEGKKITYKITGTKNDFIDFIKQYYPFLTEDVSQKLEMPDSFAGSAICSENDEWDEKLGSLIAYNRLAYNYNKSFEKKISKFEILCTEKLHQALQSAWRVNCKRDKNTCYRVETILKKFKR